MHGWTDHTDASGRQKRQRLLDLACGSLSAAAGAIGKVLCVAQQQQPRKRVTGSMRLGMPSSGGSLSTSGASTSGAAAGPEHQRQQQQQQQQQQQGGAHREFRSNPFSASALGFQPPSHHEEGDDDDDEEEDGGDCLQGFSLLPSTGTSLLLPPVSVGARCAGPPNAGSGMLLLQACPA
jgi:hypothetical protein